MAKFVIGPITVPFDNDDRAPDIFCPAKCKILRMRGQVSQPLATGDPGTVRLYDYLDNEMENGALVMPAGSPMNWKASPPAPTGHNIVLADKWFRLRAEKGSSPGGEIQVYIEAETL